MHESPKYLILISLNGLYPVFCLSFCLLIEKGKIPLVSLLKHIYGSTEFFLSTLKMLAKEANILMFFFYVEYI